MYKTTYIHENSFWRFCGRSAHRYTRILGEDLDEDLAEWAQSKGPLLPLVELVHSQLKGFGDRTGNSSALFILVKALPQVRRNVKSWSLVFKKKFYLRRSWLPNSTRHHIFYRSATGLSHSGTLRQVWKYETLHTSELPCTLFHLSAKC